MMGGPLDVALQQHGYVVAFFCLQPSGSSCSGWLSIEFLAHDRRFGWSSLPQQLLSSLKRGQYGAATREAEEYNRGDADANHVLFYSSPRLGTGIVWVLLSTAVNIPDGRG
jgi:hypothetical protein